MKLYLQSGVAKNRKLNKGVLLLKRNQKVKKTGEKKMDFQDKNVKCYKQEDN